MKKALPSVVTFVGLLFGLVGIALGVKAGWPLLLLSVAADIIDGELARALGTVSDLGGKFDLHVDVACAYGLVWRTLPITAAVIATALVIAWQLAGDRYEKRSSGRVAAWIGCAIWTFARGA
jgi:phosphatidylserine synthase